MIKALMIDVDGVLVCGRPGDGSHWSVDLEADLGLRAEDLHQAFFAPHWNDVVLGRATLEDRLSPVLATIAPQVTPERLIDYWFRQDSRLDERLLSDLHDWRRQGLQVHLATNQEHMRARHLMQVMGFADQVDGIHYSAALGVRKPDPEFFRLVSARVLLSPCELLLVDDSIENVRAAGTAGWSAAHWTGERRLAEVLSPHLMRE